MIELPKINVDWLGKRKIFLTISILLIGIGFVALLAKGSFRYGVDFQGGTIVYVRFQEPPDVDRIRQLLSDSGLPNSQIQELRGGGANNDVLIQLEQTSADETDFGQGRE